jgi:outer membrane lipase/esterase
MTNSPAGSACRALGALLVAAALASCGGGNDSKPIDRLVIFGDSLSDVGAYRVGTVAALGGGRYTVNGAGLNWTEQLASRIKIAAPCPAVTGLDGAASQGFSVPVVQALGCTGYAMGGSRVTQPVGPGNRLLGGSNAILGQLTLSVSAQMANHVGRTGGKFEQGDLVTVFAGGNDAFINFAAFGAAVGAGGDASAAAAAAVSAMSTAGGELATLVKNQILQRGAERVVVVSMPDLASTPFALGFDAQTRAVIEAMGRGFNAALSDGLRGTSVLSIDAFAGSQDQFRNPQTYSISNATTPACDLSPARNPLGSSLVCSTANVIAGDVSRYLFADAVHPTPFGYKLLSDRVYDAPVSRGWL